MSQGNVAAPGDYQVVKHLDVEQPPSLDHPARQRHVVLGGSRVARRVGVPQDQGVGVVPDGGVEHLGGLHVGVTMAILLNLPKDLPWLEEIQVMGYYVITWSVLGLPLIFGQILKRFQLFAGEADSS